MLNGPRAKSLSDELDRVGSKLAGLQARYGSVYPDEGTLAVSDVTVNATTNSVTIRAIFPNLRKYEEWEGAGHFLMMESPDRFNRVLEDFLGTLK